MVTRTSEGSLGTWVTDSKVLPDVLVHGQAVITSNRIYLLGGHTGSSKTNKIYSAPMTDGTIGTWVAESTTLPEVLIYSQAVVVSDRVFLLGGYTDDGRTNKIYSAPIVDGVIGAWVTEGNTLPETLKNSQAVVIDNRVYLLGGFNDNVRSNKIFSAPVIDGFIGAWVIESNVLPDALVDSQTVVTSNKVHILGGFNFNDHTNNKNSTPISGDSIGTWVTESNTLPETLRVSQAVVINNSVSLLGGYNGSDTKHIYSAPIADGTIGAWVTVSNDIPEVLRYSQAVVTDNKVYLLGGHNGSYINKIFSTSTTFNNVLADNKI